MEIDSCSQAAITWLNMGHYSGLLVLSPPNVFGFMLDIIFPEAMAQYLAVASLVCHPLIGQYIDNDYKVYQVDAYGNFVAAHSSLPGYGHGIIHVQIKFLLPNM